MSGIILLIVIVFVLLIYTTIPDIFLHRMGIGAWKRQYQPGVALTFDDGPDPTYTPRLLDLLDRYQVKATFFLVGERAAQHPELVQEIVTRGHQIGVHCQVHQHAWLMSPWKTWQVWTKGIATLERLTGSPIHWIRPPWGTFNLFTFLWFKHHKLRAILWSTEGHDWEARRTPEQIAERILHKVQEGGIIVLHDSGGDSAAPENTLRAVELLLQRIPVEKKLPILPLNLPDWTEYRRLAYRLWEKWENFYARQNHITRINSTSLFRLGKIKYHGPDLRDEQGVVLAHEGDIVGELHLDNTRLQMQQTDSQKIAIEALRKARTSLPVLADYIAKSPEYQDIRVFVGLTLINRGAKGLGFNVQEVPVSPFVRWVGTLQRMIMRIYHPMGKSHRMNRLGEPKIVWVSKESLIHRWSSLSPHA
ncbi:polysaccharide deacetylase family protein [Desulfitobacterium sp.]|uniref:polysaccharide deacetylase family protein n=1 Tax=Desulfitobacterium sp. TaxID=49981 RepID=UPI002B646E1E|nr:polysaccharide deacetylase family protein [Desulfitobacterium sp.]HVJ49892.1 polysaccharide deacetylase family protein [Desulfitobacterium sp.]